MKYLLKFVLFLLLVPGIAKSIDLDYQEYLVVIEFIEAKNENPKNSNKFQDYLRNGDGIKVVGIETTEKGNKVLRFHKANWAVRSGEIPWSKDIFVANYEDVLKGIIPLSKKGLKRSQLLKEINNDIFPQKTEFKVIKEGLKGKATFGGKEVELKLGEKLLLMSTSIEKGDVIYGFNVVGRKSIGSECYGHSSSVELPKNRMKEYLVSIEDISFYHNLQIMAGQKYKLAGGSIDIYYEGDDKLLEEEAVTTESICGPWEIVFTGKRVKLKDLGLKSGLGEPFSDEEFYQVKIAGLKLESPNISREMVYYIKLSDFKELK